MLQSLVELHDKVIDELPPAAYKERPIGWEVELSSAGELQGVPVEVSDRKNVPNHERSGRASRPRLIDTAEYVLGLPEENKESRAKRHHENFRDLLQRAADETGIDALKAYLNYVEHSDVADLPEEMGRRDIVLINVEGEAVHKRPDVQAWWSDYIDEVKGEKMTEHGPCAVCGEERPIARLHGKIRRFDSKLISYDKPAYRSYGKEKSYGAWTCQKCARKISRTLSWLFDSEDHRYYFNNVSWVFWTEDPAPAISLQPLKDGDPNKIKRLLSGYYDGTLLENDTPLWALGIESNEGRLIVKHQWRKTTGRVQTNLARYFDAMETGGQYFGATRLMMSLIQTASGNRTPGDIPAWIEAGLMDTALTGRPLAAPFLLTALDRNQALGRVSDPRAALLRLYLITHEHAMPSALDPDHERQSYHLGRLFATLEEIQEAAHHNLNTTITDRFFKSASTSPRSVFGNLMSKAQAHLSNLRKNKKGAYKNLQKQLGAVTNRIHDWPATLTPEEQAFFSLGYYHQREERFSGSPDAETADADANESDEQPA
ncbi:MAG: type I-C CRISPR-associated protein Cas8c/Csd1 [Bacteroidetes bacterium QS_8_68_28]|nr:MAG: type I-C CRISPR-associated protein Cas8c/Csd1 [Bacteroidetes bacterium QS_8_68_28]